MVEMVGGDELFEDEMIASFFIIIIIYAIAGALFNEYKVKSIRLC